MKKTTLLVGSILLATGLSTSAFATAFSVAGTANIFAAGQASSTSGTFDASGTAPFLGALGSGGGSVTFSGVAGTVSCGTFCASEPTGPTSNGPDGTAYNGMAPGNMNISAPGNGLSGIQFTGREGMLVAVFLDNNTPSGAGPGNYAVYNPLFADAATVFSPGLGQVFIVGNGLTGGPTDPPGVTQTFNVPSTATRMFLGFADANGFVGLPGTYADDTGSLTGNFSFVAAPAGPVPEPGTLMLMGLGLIGFGLLRKRLA